MDRMRNRLLELEGCHNFRDLGGYPTEDGRRVRWRTLFRADGLQDLSEKDVTRLRDEIGLGDIIDLRSSQELRLDGRGRLESEPIRYHHLPLFDNAASAGGSVPSPPFTSLADLYLGLIEQAMEPIGRVLSTLAGTNTPAVYHCAAGKDRTGVVSAVILGLVGVAKELIVADYAATQDNLDAIVERLHSSDGYQHVWEELPPDTLHADPKTMVALLAGIEDRYDGAEGYARSTGLKKEELESLRERVLE